MANRLQPFSVAPDAYKALMTLDVYVTGSGLPVNIVDLVQTRASQMNNCAFCIDAHVKKALDAGQDPQRLHLLAAWRDSSLFNQKERAALAWCEAVTTVADGPVPDEVYSAALEHFSPAELVRLTIAVAAINAWNRVGVGFRLVHPTGMDARLTA
ncbi:MAG: carboxymuconolactone decarboxylase family protein [Phenylobacterium sp.]|uniref:carboxymuconolactone decarboxylase family protein n=1 Tax=Phenylobacterium sp. TaxID=1871053 RepID=UPI0027377C03|nr:carboxymuconolactone decarboxylase family protein [Phenylobacterium sp.]MDP3749606.1 carboxymuconolactone decarboxylase family protein [Phenylobacterium sp.]